MGTKLIYSADLTKKIEIRCKVEISSYIMLNKLLKHCLKPHENLRCDLFVLGACMNVCIS